MVAKPLGISQARVDLIEQITHAVLSSLGHIPRHERLQGTGRLRIPELTASTVTRTSRLTAVPQHRHEPPMN
jgi:hypothetical protein